MRPKICLVRCPLITLPFPPDLGLGYISAALKSAGYETRVVDLNWDLYLCSDETLRGQWQWKGDTGVDMEDMGLRVLRQHLDDLLRRFDGLMGEDFGVFAFSVWESNRAATVLLARLLKERRPDIKIVFGGPQCMWVGDREELSSLPYLDAFVCGEGEETILDLIRALESEGRFSPCAGAYVRRDGAMVAGREREPMDLRTLPIPDFGDYYRQPYGADDRLAIAFNRGCIRKCEFCNVPGYYPQFRWRPAESIFHEIKHQMARYRARRFIEFSPTSNSNLKELMRLCDMITGEGLDIEWEGFGIFTRGMTLPVLKKLREAGCYNLAFGLETGSQKVADLMRKGFQISDAEQILKDCKKVGIAVSIGIIVGFPGETEEDFQATMRFVERNAENISWVGSVSTMVIHYNSPIFSKPNPEIVDMESGFRWRTADGSNTLDIREDRRRRFVEFASSLGLYSAQKEQLVQVLPLGAA